MFINERSSESNMIRLNLIDKKKKVKASKEGKKALARRMKGGSIESTSEKGLAKVGAGTVAGAGLGAVAAVGANYLEESLGAAAKLGDYSILNYTVGMGMVGAAAGFLATNRIRQGINNLAHKVSPVLARDIDRELIEDGVEWTRDKIGSLKERREEFIEEVAEKHPSLVEKIKLGQTVPLAGGLASGVMFGAATYHQTGSVLGALAAPLIGTYVGIKRAAKSSKKAPLEGIIHNYNSALASGVGVGAAAIESVTGNGMIGGLILGGVTAGSIALAKFRADDEKGNSLFKDLRREDRVGYIVVEVGNKGYDVFPADQKLPLCPIPIGGKEEYATREIVVDGKVVTETVQRPVKNKKGEIVRSEPVKKRPWMMPYIKPVLDKEGNPVVISNRVQQHQLEDRIDVTGKDSSTVDGRLTFEYQVVNEQGARNAYLKIADLPGQLEETIAGAVKNAFANLDFGEFQRYDPNVLVEGINRCLGPNYEGIEIQSINYIDIQPTGRTKDTIAQEHEALQSGRLAAARQSNLDAEIGAARAYLTKMGHQKPTPQQIETVVERARAYAHEQNLGGNVVRVDTSALATVLEKALGGNNLGSAPMSDYDVGEGPTINADYRDVSGEQVKVVQGRPTSPPPRNPTPTPGSPFGGYRKK